MSGVPSIYLIHPVCLPACQASCLVKCERSHLLRGALALCFLSKLQNRRVHPDLLRMEAGPLAGALHGFLGLSDPIKEASDQRRKGGRQA